MQDACLYFGHVMHRRLRPRHHRFRYRVFSLYGELGAFAVAAKRIPLFSHNRFNVFSFHDCDHGPRDGGPLRPWIEAHLGEAGIDLDGGTVRLLCFPRIFGYVFNPLSLWFCYHRNGELRAVLYEVSNTFGESHCYLMPVAYGRRPGEPLRQSCAKTFYVSPFIPMRARYDFRLHEPDERLAVAIREFVDGEELLVAVQSGQRSAMTTANMMRALLAYPLMTLKIMGAIHWEAFRLWRKGARYHRRPSAPAEDISVIAEDRPQAAE